MKLEGYIQCFTYCAREQKHCWHKYPFYWYNKNLHKFEYYDSICKRIGDKNVSEEELIDNMIPTDPIYLCDLEQWYIEAYPDTDLTEKLNGINDDEAYHRIFMAECQKRNIYHKFSDFMRPIVLDQMKKWIQKHGVSGEFQVE